MVRTAGDPLAFVPSLRAAVRAQDPGVVLRAPITLAGYSSLALFPQQLAARLLAVLGATALGLALVGIYAVVSYSVGQRTQEFGVRLALGATRAGVLRQVLMEGARLAAAGGAVGLLGGVAGARLLERFLFGADPYAPAILLGLPLALVATAVLACVGPAWRATRVDVAEALRAE